MNDLTFCLVLFFRPKLSMVDWLIGGDRDQG